MSDCGYIDWAYCTFVKDEEKSKDATCTTDEVLVKKCSVCGQSYTDNVNNKKKLNHDMQLVKTVAPTCSDEGYDLYKCSRCDVTEKEILFLQFPEVTIGSLLKPLPLLATRRAMTFIHARNVNQLKRKIFSQSIRLITNL